MKHAFAVAMLLLVACQRQATADDARAVANAWFKAQFNSEPDKRLIAHTEDLGDRWRITYAPPPDAAGEYTSLLIDKRTRKVIDSEGTQ